MTFCALCLVESLSESLSDFSNYFCAPKFYLDWEEGLGRVGGGGRMRH